MAFVDFAATDSTDKAVKLNGTESLGSWSLVVDYNAPRPKGEKGEKGKGKKKGGKDGKKGKGKKSGPAASATGAIVESTGKKMTFADSDSD